MDSTDLSSYVREADGGILQQRLCSRTLRVRSHEFCLRVAYILLEPGRGACFCRRWGPGWQGQAGAPTRMRRAHCECDINRAVTCVSNRFEELRIVRIIPCTVASYRLILPFGYASGPLAIRDMVSSRRVLHHIALHCQKSYRTKHCSWQLFGAWPLRLLRQVLGAR